MQAMSDPLIDFDQFGTEPEVLESLWRVDGRSVGLARQPNGRIGAAPTDAQAAELEEFRQHRPNVHRLLSLVQTHASGRPGVCGGELGDTHRAPDWRD